MFAFKYCSCNFFGQDKELQNFTSILNNISKHTELSASVPLKLAAQWAISKILQHAAGNIIINFFAIFCKRN